MLIGKKSEFQLTYCTNIHPGESWSAVFANLERYVLPLKSKLSPQHAFGIGLRLSNQAATELLIGKTLENFKSWLDSHGLYVQTINGFVYDHFHDKPVKEQVYAPNWSTSERQVYSVKLLEILTTLTPPQGSCGFSSAPLCYQPGLSPNQQRQIRQEASLRLAELVVTMVNIEQTTAKHLHIDLEPEPDCLLTTTENIIDFFNQYLLPLGIPHLVQKLGVTAEQARAYLLRHIQVCYDVCHLAVAYEQPETVFARLAAAEIKIGKLQISTALRVEIPTAAADRLHLQHQLTPYAESTYLHQVIARHRDGSLQRYADLPLALYELPTTQACEWRIHFHLPIFIEQCPFIQTTQSDLIAALSLLQHNQATHCLEIETYTWDVLPTELKLAVTDSLAREYRWVLQQFH